MSLIDRLRRRPTPVADDEFSPMPGFRIEYGEETQFTVDPDVLALMRSGQAQRTAQEQFYVLDMLAEEGRAAVLDDGFVVPAEEIARLDDDEARVLNLPKRFTGKIIATTHRWTASPGFRIELELQIGAHPSPVRRRGPVVKVDGTLYRVSVPLLRALQAIDDHRSLEESRRTESENVRLVARLQAAQRLATPSRDAADRDPTFDLPLGSLDHFTTVSPTKVGLSVAPQSDGSLAVEPSFGDEVDPWQLSKRWHQLDRQFSQAGPDDASAAVLRVDDTLVLLEPEHVAGVQEVRRRPHIPREQVATFLEAPGSFYDPDLVDVESHFGVRVIGLGLIAPMTFAEATSSGLDWFGEVGQVHTPEVLAEAAESLEDLHTIEEDVSAAWERGDSVVPVGKRLVDVSDRDRVAEAFEASRRRLEQLNPDEVPALAGTTPQVPQDTGGPKVTVGMHIRDAADISDRLRARAAEARPVAPVDYSSLRRSPFPHQRVGIEWMTGLMQSAHASDESDEARIQGGLLADDMGLGKTFMTLVALAEAHRAQVDRGAEPLPSLAVMPVALIENWLAEIEATFGTRNGPFTEVVVLQGRGLDDYRMRGAGPETRARAEDLDEHGMVRPDRIIAALRTGPEWRAARLDRPGVLVLTTYENLRRYQVSLGRVDWGVVIFDEAQATKNPEILTTRAAKALKARFKLLATGTPVENSLRDFWSLMDTAQPGLLGTWAQFREAWVEPMEAATGEEHQRLGRALREAVGTFMLRRVKEDHLTDLPPKQVHEYPLPMPEIQVRTYDEVLARHHARAGIKGAALKTLHELADVALHPRLVSGDLDGRAERFAESARTLATVREILDGIRARDEKAIVFAKRKELQRALRLWLGELYGLHVDVVNGDTAATGRSETRLAKIRQFEARPGFNVIIMSPLAVGVGLTVVGANHAIHLERHWNPAKEAQATDRIHRIGQTREVHVHYPMGVHPRVDSFDINLDRLLRSKVALKDAVVVPQEVTQEEMERALGLR